MIKISVECDDCGRVGCIVQVVNAREALKKSERDGVTITLGNELLRDTLLHWTEKGDLVPYYGPGVIGDRLVCPRCQRESRR